MHIAVWPDVNKLPKTICKHFFRVFPPIHQRRLDGFWGFFFFKKTKTAFFLVMSLMGILSVTFNVILLIAGRVFFAA